VRTEGVEDPAPGTWLVRVWETDPEEAENVRANLPEAGDEAKRRRGLEGHPPCASSCSRVAAACLWRWAPTDILDALQCDSGKDPDAEGELATHLFMYKRGNSHAFLGSGAAAAKPDAP
jgi:hypothetical protein